MLNGNQLILGLLMKDIIWTLIGIWLIYKIVDILKIGSAKRANAYVKDSHAAQEQSGSHKASRPESDIKNAVKNHLNNEGEYIDFEEVK